MVDTPRDMTRLSKEELSRISKDLQTNVDLELAMGYFKQLMPRISEVMVPGLGIDKIVKALVILDKKLTKLQSDIDELKDQICAPVEEDADEEPAVVLDGATGKVVDGGQGPQKKPVK